VDKYPAFCQQAVVHNSARQFTAVAVHDVASFGLQQGGGRQSSRLAVVADGFFDGFAVDAWLFVQPSLFTLFYIEDNDIEVILLWITLKKYAFSRCCLVCACMAKRASRNRTNCG
jgi:hypothetical protein